MTTTTLTITSESTTTLSRGGLTVRISTDETTGRHIVTTGYRSRDHRTTTEHATLTAARADAMARLESAARAVATCDLFEVAV